MKLKQLPMTLRWTLVFLIFALYSHPVLSNDKVLRSFYGPYQLYAYAERSGEAFVKYVPSPAKAGNPHLADYALVKTMTLNKDLMAIGPEGDKNRCIPPLYTVQEEIPNRFVQNYIQRWDKDLGIQPQQKNYNIKASCKSKDGLNDYQLAFLVLNEQYILLLGHSGPAAIYRKN